MYIYILEYVDARLYVEEVPDDTDAEDYVSEKYGLDDTEYMTSDKLRINVNTI